MRVALACNCDGLCYIIPVPFRKQRIKLATEAVKNAVGCYFVALLLTSMILDGGQTFRGVLMLAVIHCAISIYIFAARFNRMTRGDYMVVSFGLFNGSTSAPSFWFSRKRPKSDEC